jgi:hypothetical protein
LPDWITKRQKQKNKKKTGHQTNTPETSSTILAHYPDFCSIYIFNYKKIYLYTSMYMPYSIFFKESFNNSTNINKTNNYLLSQLTEHKKTPPHIHVFRSIFIGKIVVNAVPNSVRRVEHLSWTISINNPESPEVF